MTKTLQEISDRFEVMDLLTDYSEAIDEKNIDALDPIFTEDALIDYSKAGGPKGKLLMIKQFLKENLGDLPHQHIISNHKVQIEGDRAKGRFLCLNPVELLSEEVMLWGIWYEDEFIRTKDGWKISKKVTRPCFNWKMKRISE